MSRVNYVAELERFLDPPQPEPPPPPPPPRPGRRKALGTGAVRDQGQFLQAIAKIISAGKGYCAIPKQLQRLQEYEDLSERQLQRDVAKTLGLFDFLFSGYPKRERRKRVLEFLRHSWARYLQRNN